MPQHQIYSSPLAQGLASWQWPRTLRKLTFEFCQFIFNRGVSWPTCNLVNALTCAFTSWRTLHTPNRLS